MSIRLLACFLLILATDGARGADVLNAEVALVGDRYKVDFAVILQGDMKRAWDLITDYRRFTALSPTVMKSRLISGRTGGDARIEVVLQPCVWLIFCKTVTKTSDVKVYPDLKRLRYAAVAGAGDFREAREIIELSDASGDGVARVRFSYSAVLKPAFFVPPFVGPWLIKRAIIKDLETSGRRVENVLSGRESEPRG